MLIEHRPSAHLESLPPPADNSIKACAQSCSVVAACTKFRCSVRRNERSCFVKLATFIATMSRTIKQRIWGFYWTLLMPFHAHQFRNSNDVEASTMAQPTSCRSAYVNEIWIFHLFLSSALDDLETRNLASFSRLSEELFYLPERFSVPQKLQRRRHCWSLECAGVV